MKRHAYIALLAAAIPAAAMAQSAVDAQQISQSDFKGTARFMSMGGAFTALGGDLSTLNQNPAGIGIYRSSEIGATLDINMQSTTTEPAWTGFPNKSSQTKAYCNNFGYIGSARLGGAMRTFNWGVTYNRAASFDRIYQGYTQGTQTSLSNYVASYSGIYSTDELGFTDNFNPYLDNTESVDWLSIMSYNSLLINPNGSGGYQGLFSPQQSYGDALYSVREKGGIDEYDISFGGNVENVVYWGLSFGITDLNYTRTLYYSEGIDNAIVPLTYNSANYGYGDATFDLGTTKAINGSGFNMKLGVIVKPINELRVGVAIHTPTWYSITQQYVGEVDSQFTPYGSTPGSLLDTYTANDYTEDAYFNWHYTSPWKMMFGAAAVLGGRAIVSLDYQYDAYGNQKVATPVYGAFGNTFESNGYINSDIKSYYQGASTVRLGLEYRVTPQFSVRAGYNTQTSNAKSSVADGLVEVLTSGTDPSYSLDKSMYNICAGLGYRYQAWYIDAAYVYRHRESTFHAYTNFSGNIAPQWSLADSNSSIVLSTGFKF